MISFRVHMRLLEWKGETVCRGPSAVSGVLAAADDERRQPGRSGAERHGRSPAWVLGCEERRREGDIGTTRHCGAAYVGALVRAVVRDQDTPSAACPCPYLHDLVISRSNLQHLSISVAIGRCQTRAPIGAAAGGAAGPLPGCAGSPLRTRTVWARRVLWRRRGSARRRRAGMRRRLPAARLRRTRDGARLRSCCRARWTPLWSP